MDNPYGGLADLIQQQSYYQGGGNEDMSNLEKINDTIKNISGKDVEESEPQTKSGGLLKYLMAMMGKGKMAGSSGFGGTGGGMPSGTMSVGSGGSGMGTGGSMGGSGGGSVGVA